MERERMARAAGCYTEAGVIATAKTIKRFMIEKQIPYYNAAGQVMVTRDEMWFEDEHAAFHEAFVELYGNDDANYKVETGA